LCIGISKNKSKILSICSSAIPTPESSTAIKILAVSCEILKLIFPPFGVYLNALEIKL